MKNVNTYFLLSDLNTYFLLTFNSTKNMYFDIIVSLIINAFLHNKKYYSLYNCMILTLSSLLKLLFYDNYIFHRMVLISGLSSSLYYFYDTIKMLSNKEINIFILHHILSIELLINRYIFDYDIYISYFLLFLTEFSSVIYNLYYYKFIKIKTHISLFVPLRIILNIAIVYFIIYENRYTYYTDLILDTTAWILLFVFNVSSIVKCCFKFKLI